MIEPTVWRKISCLDLIQVLKPTANIQHFILGERVVEVSHFFPRKNKYPRIVYEPQQHL